MCIQMRRCGEVKRMQIKMRMHMNYPDVARNMLTSAESHKMLCPWKALSLRVN